MVELVVDRSAPVVVGLESDEGGGPLTRLGSWISGGEFRWGVVSPIRAAGRLVGLTVGTSSRRQAWSDDQLRLVELCCGRLGAMIDRECLDQSLRTAAMRLEETGRDLERLTMVDPLTGLANRTAWRVGRPLSLLVAEIDHFASYTETFGARLGDRCVTQVATELARGSRRAGDFSARMGPTTFAVLLPGAAADDAVRAAERVRAGVEGLRIPHDGGHPVRPWLTVSIGVSTVVPKRGRSPATLRGTAERALHEAAESGGNRVWWRSVDGDNSDGGHGRVGGVRRPRDTR